MFDRFTDDARRVVVEAQEEVQTLGHRHIGTEHLLLGVLHTDDPAVHMVCAAAGLDLDVVRTRLVATAGRIRRKNAGHIPFSAGAGQVLEKSLQLSKRLGPGQVAPEHLLIAILDTPECTAAQLLGLHGADRDDLESAARRVAAQRQPESGAG